MSKTPEPKVCNKLYEKIADGTKPDDILYNNQKFGILAVLARDAVNRSHVLVIPHECAPEVDVLSPTAHSRLFIASRYIGTAIGAAFRTSPNDRVNVLASGMEIAHAHLHRFLVEAGNEELGIQPEGNMPWLRFARVEPFLRRTEEEAQADIADILEHFGPDQQAAMEAEMAAVSGFTLPILGTSPNALGTSEPA
jgi:diadenosine tetraphosphate (Ap4A) HIT family hydrolase